MVPDPLAKYRAKRAFELTPEPDGSKAASSDGDVKFVVQKHDARRLHYDFRLEADGVLISWAVPKGPSYDPKVKRLAVHVEDHPLDYQSFEGLIPGAQYGAGTVIVWDQGTYRNLTAKNGRPVAVADAVRNGHLSVWLDGLKLRGGWSLTRTGGGTKESWIMVKRADELADPALDVTAEAPDSVLSGRSLDQIATDQDTARWTRERATWQPPMLAQLVKPAHHYAADRSDQWRYERKLDGLRCVAVRNGGQVELWSRNRLSFNDRFPEVVTALAALPADNFTVDGELVAFVGDRTSFAQLQRPGGSPHPVYCVFDLLQLLGRDTTGLPLADRQALLVQAMQGAPAAVSVVSALEGGPEELLLQACKNGWEGIIAKRRAAKYQAGRSSDWLKLKCTASQELVIGGWTEPSGSRVGFGALLVGHYDDEGLFHYAGKVGTGFDQQLLRDLYVELKARQIDESPFAEATGTKGAHWVRPELVAAVSFSEWTTDGRLRHPSFQGLRSDKEARSVRREMPAEG